MSPSFRRLARSFALTGLAVGTAICLASDSAHATSIDFDELPDTGGEVAALPGSQYDAQGIHFSSGTIASVPGVGDEFTATDLVDEFAYASNGNSVSSPNFAGARFIGLQDTFFAFSSPVSDLSMRSDDAADAPTFRLLALELIGPDSYRVLAVDEGVTGSGDFLSVSVAGGFSFAAFQVTTEQEGFDDLSFTPLPEPGSLSMVGLGLALVAMGRSRRGRSRD